VLLWELVEEEESELLVEEECEDEEFEETLDRLELLREDECAEDEREL
jgi:hypothetical protein